MGDVTLGNEANQTASRLSGSGSSDAINNTPASNMINVNSTRNKELLLIESHLPEDRTVTDELWTNVFFMKNLGFNLAETITKHYNPDGVSDAEQTGQQHEQASTVIVCSCHNIHSFELTFNVFKPDRMDAYHE